MIFFFNDTATTEIYTLSLHDALPISSGLLVTNTVSTIILEQRPQIGSMKAVGGTTRQVMRMYLVLDRKSTRLNSSHANISYAVFCLKKKTTGRTSLRGLGGLRDTIHP